MLEGRRFDTINGTKTNSSKTSQDHSKQAFLGLLFKVEKLLRERGEYGKGVMKLFSSFYIFFWHFNQYHFSTLYNLWCSCFIFTNYDDILICRFYWGINSTSLAYNPIMREPLRENFACSFTIFYIILSLHIDWLNYVRWFNKMYEQKMLLLKYCTIYRCLYWNNIISRELIGRY